MAQNDNTIDETNEEQLNKYLIFRVDEFFALDLSSVVEIIEMRPITKMPETAPYIAGVINLRGDVLPAINMRARFKKEETSPGTRPVMVVIRFAQMRLALVVDEVADLIEIEPDNLTPPPQVGTDYSHVFVKGIGIVGEQMHLILDADKLVNLSEIEQLTK